MIQAILIILKMVFHNCINIDAYRDAYTDDYIDDYTDEYIDDYIAIDYSTLLLRPFSHILNKINNFLY